MSLLQLRESIGTVCDELCVSKRLIRDFGRRSLLLSGGWRSPILLSLHNVVHLDGPIGTTVIATVRGPAGVDFRVGGEPPTTPPNTLNELRLRKFGNRKSWNWKGTRAEHYPRIERREDAVSGCWSSLALWRHLTGHFDRRAFFVCNGRALFASRSAGRQSSSCSSLSHPALPTASH